MSVISSGGVSEYCTRLSGTCRKKLLLMENGTISVKDFCANLMVTMVHEPRECWGVCLDVLGAGMRAQFAKYLRDTLVPLDFMPSPNVFMVGHFTDDAVEAKKREMRPVYMELSEYVCRRELEQ